MDTDAYDTKARIMIVKHDGKIVGSMRLAFPEAHEATEQERFVEDPTKLPKKIESVVATRLCTSPAFRGADIFHELMAHMVLSVVKAGRRYLYFGAAGSLIELYVRCGMRRTGILYRNTDLGGTEHELLVMDVYDLAKGHSISIRYWNKLYGNLVQYLIQQEYISPTPFEMARIRFFRFIGSVLK